jgi:methyl-accepting chemotaxis protein
MTFMFKGKVHVARFCCGFKATSLEGVSLIDAVLAGVGAPIHWASQALLFFLQYDASVFVLCAFGAFWCWRFINQNKKLHFDEAMTALQSRGEVLSRISEAADPSAAQERFSEDFEKIAEVMGKQDRKELALAWEQFRETIIDENESTIRTTARAEFYFLHLADDTRVLAWGANIAVAVGLTATFLGLIAALTSAMGTLSGAANGTETTQALQGLLQITAAKFWTSVTGIICSIVLRRTDRKWHDQLQQQLEAISQLLDRGTLYTPSQRIAADQLREMKRQTESFQALGTELATAIDNALNNRMSPVVQALGDISNNIEQFRSGGFDQISQDLGSALREHTGQEMQALAQSLNGMTAKFDTLSSGLANVPQSLETSLREIRQAFDSEQEETRRRQREAGDQMAEQLEKVAEKLEGVTGQFSQDLVEKLTSTIEAAADSSGTVLSDAFARFGEQMSESADELVDRLSLLANNAAPLSEAMARAAEATNKQAKSLEVAGRSTEEAGGKLSAAVTDLNAALAPVATAARSISEAASSISTALKSHETATEELTGQLIATASSAEKAWENYESRFTDVDEALGKTLDGLVSATAEHATAVNQQIGELDNELAKAVSNLRDALEPLEELADEISALLEQLKS